MRDLPHPHNQHLRSAEGWLELGNHLEAGAELERIDQDLKRHPLVLEMACRIHAAAGQWERAVEAAAAVREILPENPWGHFHLAYGLHELKRTEEARRTLEAVAREFPDHYLMRYNLACYCCQLGDLKQAMAWLREAIGLAGQADIRAMALEDPDLEPLRKRIQEL